MIKKIYNQKNFFEEYNHEIKDEDYYLFKTSGSEGEQKNVLIRKDVFINNFNKYIKSLEINLNQKILITSKMSIEHPYAFGLYSIIDNLIFYENIKNKIEEMKQVDVIFSTPSFFINFKDFIKINTNQKIIFTGEDIPNSLKNSLKEYNVYQSFGMTEALNIGIKKMDDIFYSFIDKNIKIENNYIYSPYLCSYILENDFLKTINNQYLIKDSIEVKNNKFCFLERESEIVKINEEKISLKVISNFLFSLKEINDLVIFKNKINELDNINLFYVSDLNKKEIENKILNHFKNNNYIPKIIIKIDSIPLTKLGKKDILKLKNEYKIE
jgi:hypothetical protein